jgi:predicted esterase YcpF (UPF0227 family)
MTIYIHGFGGNGEGNKAKAFREYFKTIGEPFIAPSLSYIPSLAISTLEELIQSYKENVTLIGSSLGGYYTLYLAQKYNLKAVVINPSINPQITLSRAIPKAPSFYDNSLYEWNENHLKSLETYKTKAKTHSNIVALIQLGDELLNPNEAIEFLDGSRVVVEEGGNHSFDGIERHFEMIRYFLVSKE